MRDDRGPGVLCGKLVDESGQLVHMLYDDMPFVSAFLTRTSRT
ncbi:hypothetical protein [Saccharopolyspora elongata]|nr:hypothetical protein [Saccharopolyspora elongata]